LDYACRAKNITNRPEINQKLTKKSLIKVGSNDLLYMNLCLQMPMYVYLCRRVIVACAKRVMHSSSVMLRVLDMVMENEQMILDL
jgi:hypothetical protein